MMSHGDLSGTSPSTPPPEPTTMSLSVTETLTNVFKALDRITTEDPTSKNVDSPSKQPSSVPSGTLAGLIQSVSSDAEAQVNHMRDMLVEAERKIEVLQQENETHQQQSLAAVSRSVDSQTMVAALELELMQTRSTIQDVSAQLEDEKSQREMLQLRLHKEQLLSKQAVARAADAESLVFGAQSEARAAQEQVTKASEREQQLTAQIADLEHKVKKLEDEHTAKDLKLRESQKEIDRLGESERRAQSVATVSKSNIDDLCRKLKAAEEDAKEHELKAAEIRATCEHDMHTINQLRDTITEWERRYHELSAKFVATEQRLVTACKRGDEADLLQRRANDADRRRLYAEQAQQQLELKVQRVLSGATQSLMPSAASEVPDAAKLELMAAQLQAKTQEVVFLKEEFTSLDLQFTEQQAFLHIATTRAATAESKLMGAEAAIATSSSRISQQASALSRATEVEKKLRSLNDEYLLAAKNANKDKSTLEREIAVAKETIRANELQVAEATHAAHIAHFRALTAEKLACRHEDARVMMEKGYNAATEIAEERSSQCRRHEEVRVEAERLLKVANDRCFKVEGENVELTATCEMLQERLREDKSVAKQAFDRALAAERLAAHCATQKREADSARNVALRREEEMEKQLQEALIAKEDTERRTATIRQQALDCVIEVDVRIEAAKRRQLQADEALSYVETLRAEAKSLQSIANEAATLARLHQQSAKAVAERMERFVEPSSNDRAAELEAVKRQIDEMLVQAASREEQLAESEVKLKLLRQQRFSAEAAAVAVDWASSTAGAQQHQTISFALPHDSLKVSLPSITPLTASEEAATVALGDDEYHCRQLVYRLEADSMAGVFSAFAAEMGNLAAKSGAEEEDLHKRLSDSRALVAQQHRRIKEVREALVLSEERCQAAMVNYACAEQHGAKQLETIQTLADRLKDFSTALPPAMRKTLMEVIGTVINKDCADFSHTITVEANEHIQGQIAAGIAKQLTYATATQQAAEEERNTAQIHVVRVNKQIHVKEREVVELRRMVAAWELFAAQAHGELYHARDRTAAWTWEVLRMSKELDALHKQRAEEKTRHAQFALAVSKAKAEVGQQQQETERVALFGECLATKLTDVVPTEAFAQASDAFAAHMETASQQAVLRAKINELEDTVALQHRTHQQALSAVQEQAQVTASQQLAATQSVVPSGVVTRRTRPMMCVAGTQTNPDQPNVADVLSPPSRSPIETPQLGGRLSPPPSPPPATPLPPTPQTDTVIQKEIVHVPDVWVSKLLQQELQEATRRREVEMTSHQQLVALLQQALKDVSIGRLSAERTAARLSLVQHSSALTANQATPSNISTATTGTVTTPPAAVASVATMLQASPETKRASSQTVEEAASVEQAPPTTQVGPCKKCEELQQHLSRLQSAYNTERIQSRETTHGLEVDNDRLANRANNLTQELGNLQRAASVSQTKIVDLQNQMSHTERRITEKEAEIQQLRVKVYEAEAKAVKSAATTKVVVDPKMEKKLQEAYRQQDIDAGELYSLRTKIEELEGEKDARQREVAIARSKTLELELALTEARKKGPVSSPPSGTSTPPAVLATPNKKQEVGQQSIHPPPLAPVVVNPQENFVAVEGEDGVMPTLTVQHPNTSMSDSAGTHPYGSHTELPNMSATTAPPPEVEAPPALSPIPRAAPDTSTVHQPPTPPQALHESMKHVNQQMWTPSAIRQATVPVLEKSLQQDGASIHRSFLPGEGATKATKDMADNLVKVAQQLQANRAYKMTLSERAQMRGAEIAAQQECETLEAALDEIHAKLGEIEALQVAYKSRSDRLIEYEKALEGKVVTAARSERAARYDAQCAKDKLAFVEKDWAKLRHQKQEARRELQAYEQHMMAHWDTLSSKPDRLLDMCIGVSQQELDEAYGTTRHLVTDGIAMASTAAAWQNGVLVIVCVVLAAYLHHSGALLLAFE